ncbi:MAG TPA: alpha/beta hydrolase [Candidatus Lumbricidophila sp.]|nr:alpha/beta hydrolase [Candidatus Lumbricidophila sp.]
MMTPSPYAERLAQIPTTSHSATIGGADVHWWEYGNPEGRTLVLVHGFRGDHHGLEPVIAYLDDYRIISPDLPAFGESGPLAGAHSIDGYATWLHAFIAKIAPPADWVLVGHSFGSIVTSAAVAGGLRPTELVLINPIGYPALQGPRAILTRLATWYYAASAALPERLGFALLRSRLIVRVMSVSMAKTNEKELRRFIHDQHDRYFSKFHNRGALLDAFRASVSHDVREYAPAIPLPTLLIAADRDDITPITAQRRLVTMFPQAQLVELTKVGHLIHYEQPQAAAGAIRLFLESAHA